VVSIFQRFDIDYDEGLCVDVSNPKNHIGFSYLAEFLYLLLIIFLPL